MREIAIKDLTKVIDPMALGKEWAIAAASDGRETNGLTIGWASYGRLWNKPSATVYVHRTSRPMPMAMVRRGWHVPPWPREPMCSPSRRSMRASGPGTTGTACTRSTTGRS